MTTNSQYIDPECSGRERGSRVSTWISKVERNRIDFMGVLGRWVSGMGRWNGEGEGI